MAADKCVRESYRYSGYNPDKMPGFGTNKKHAESFSTLCHIRDAKSTYVTFSGVFFFTCY